MFCMYTTNGQVCKVLGQLVNSQALVEIKWVTSANRSSVGYYLDSYCLRLYTFEYLLSVNWVVCSRVATVVTSKVTDVG